MGNGDWAFKLGIARGTNFLCKLFCPLFNSSGAMLSINYWNLNSETWSKQITNVTKKGISLYLCFK